MEEQKGLIVTKRKREQFQIIAKTFSGLEELLAVEVARFGGRKVRLLQRGVAFEADQACLYRLNYRSRTALRFLKVIAEHPVHNAQDLYQFARKIKWDQYFHLSSTFAVDAVVNHHAFRNTQFAALKVKDAIADYFRSKSGKRPTVNKQNPDILIHLHLTSDKCTLLLDSTGESLHKRGYRKRQGIAPLNEVLAAGMILLSGWTKDKPLYDPMCGSGTLLTEATMIAIDMPGGYFRTNFSFMNWKDFNPVLWNKIRSEYKFDLSSHLLKIAGSDIDKSALKIAQQNLKSAGFDNLVRLSQIPVEQSSPPFDEDHGFIITNPPYGERLKKTDLKELYKTLGNVLKRNFAGWDAWILSADLKALHSIGLKPSRKIVLFNGPLECRFVHYELYGKEISTRENPSEHARKAEESN